MNAETIQAGNKLIAELLGWRFEIEPDDFGGELIAFFKDNMMWRGGRPDYIETMMSSEHGFAFHCNWNKLMPVVELIPKLNPDNGKLHFEFQISRCHCAIWSNRENEWKNNWDTTIGATWKSVVEFITWYNSTTELSKTIKS